MAGSEWWWLGSSGAWFVILNVVVVAIAVLSSRARARAPPSPSARLGGRVSRRPSSAVLQRLMSLSIFSFPSACLNTWPDTPPAAAVHETQEPGTAAREPKQPSRPSAPAPLAAAADDDDEVEEDPNSMSMEEVYALVLAERRRPAPTEEEARRSEVDAAAAEFVRGFEEDERQRRLDSIANYTQMLRDRAAAAGRRRLPG